MFVITRVMTKSEGAPRFQRVLTHAAKALLVYAATTTPANQMPTCVEQVFQVDQSEQDSEVPRINEMLIIDALSIATYNIKSGERGVQAVADELAEQKADVLCLQEAVASNLETIADTTGFEHRAEGWARQSDKEPFGNITFSSTKIIDSRVVPLPRIYDEQRVLLITEHRNEDGNFFVLNTHLTPKNAVAVIEGSEGQEILERDLQAMAVMAEVERLPFTDPVFFCGDLNALPGSSTYATMTAENFVDEVGVFGSEAMETFAGSNRQIDYVLPNGKEWLYKEVRTFGEQQTDHCGVEARFVKVAKTVDA